MQSRQAHFVGLCSLGMDEETYAHGYSSSYGDRLLLDESSALLHSGSRTAFLRLERNFQV